MAKNLSKSEIFMIEVVLNYIFRVFKYPKIYKTNIFKIFVGYLIFILPQKTLKQNG